MLFVKDSSRLIVNIAMLVTMCVMAVVSLGVGPVALSVSDVWHVLLFPSSAEMPSQSAIVWHIRLPRVLLGVLVGAGLAVCGAVMQGLFRNPLADPGLIGISSGATLGASLAIVLGQTLISNAVIQPWLTPLSAFVFASIVTLIVYRLATREGQTNVATLLLAGVAIQAITLSGVGLLTYMADDTQLRDMTFWSMGSLGGAQWQTLMITALFFVPAIAVLFKQASGLNAMLLGEAEARHIGVSVERLKIMIILFSTLLVGVLVAASGLIGFIGLVVPHLVRLLIGADHRYLLPASALLGASLLVLADTAARTLVSPAELPIGILTALIGGPFFVYLLLQQRQRAWL